MPTEQLLLSLPLGEENFINIEVPAAVVQEWREVGAKKSFKKQKFLEFNEND